MNLNLPRKLGQCISKHFTNSVDSFEKRRFNAIREFKNTTELFLTFDDGPDPAYTARISEMLSLNGHRATFFMVGKNAVNNPQIVHEVLSAGHAIGSHSFEHRKQWETNTLDLMEDYRKGHDQLQSVAGLKVDLFRPPYGYNDRRSVAFCRKNNLRLILWSIDSFDWQETATALSVSEVVLSEARPGAIVLMHDSIFDNPKVKNREHSVSALSTILDHFDCNNWKSVAVPSAALDYSNKQEDLQIKHETL